MDSLAISIISLIVGFVVGHNVTWRMASDDMAILARFRLAATNLRFRRRFMIEDYVAEWHAEYVVNGDVYAVRLRCKEDDGKVTMR